MTISDIDDDVCDLEAPRAGSCWTKTFLPRGVRVRSNYAARNMRRTLKSLPQWWLALVIAAHVTVWPVATVSMDLLQPAAVKRIARDSNEDALQTIWSLVEGMFYGDQQSMMLWGDEVDSLETNEVREALRSERAFGGMTRALVSALQDPYSSYVSESELSLPPVSSAFGLSLQTPTPGGRGGAAIKGLEVSGVYPDSPAENAGLRMGDSILQVGGIDQAAGTLTQEMITAVLRGYSGVKAAPTAAGPSTGDAASIGDASIDAASVGNGDGISLRVQRGSETPKWVTLRPSAPFTPVRARLLADRVGYVRIKQFTESGTAALSEALSSLRGEGAEAWVLDLRNNPGGQLTEAMTQASMLLPDGKDTVAFTVDAAGFHEAHTANRVLLRSQPGGQGQAVDARKEQTAARSTAADASGATTPSALDPLSPLHELLPRNEPVVLMVDGGTASSAELFAAALRDNGRAVLVGEHTFGKGMIQRIFPLPNGGALKLTIGEYFTPKHERLTHGVGLQPDVTCAAAPSDDDVCMTRAAGMARARRPAVGTPGRPQLASTSWQMGLRRMPKG